MDIEEIRKWHSIFKQNNELFEIRLILNGNLFSGYFYDIEECVNKLQPYDNMNIYFSVNKINDACSSRTQFNQFIKVKGTATSKRDIVQRLYIPIDIDVERPSDICSTDEEKSYAHQKAIDVYRFLKDNLFSEPIICDSSSGYHLYYPIDMVANEESEQLIKRFFLVLSNFFTDERVKIDPAVCDANRIMRLSGSWSRKGRNSEERPHRMSKILKYPQEQKRMSFEYVLKFVEKYEIENHDSDKGQSHNFNHNFHSEDFDVRKFLQDNGIEVVKEMPWDNGGTKLILKECPFDNSHHAPDSAVFIKRDGSLGFKCLHASCSNYNWKSLRLKFDPNAYDKQQEQKIFRQPYVPYSEQQKQKKYKIQEELPELGEKWLSMSSIKKVDLTQLERVKTGFHELDRNIVGLYMSEVTVLSGSNSSGKSSWLNSLLLNIVNQGEKIALWSGELRPDILKTWIQMVAAGKDNLKPSQYGDGKHYVPNAVAEKIDSWLDGKFFLYNNEYGTRWNQIFHDMNELLKVGVKVFVLDNLFSLDIDLFDGDKNNKQRELIIQIKDFAKKNQVHIILVAHPRKVMTFLRKNDISGSSDISNAVDNVFIIHRVNNDFIKAITEFYDSATASRYSSFGNVLSIEKNRMYGVVDVMCGFQYEIESRRFKNDIRENIVYGWQSGEQHNMYSQVQQDSKVEQKEEIPFAPFASQDCPF
jgi:archaellum biogenesis ATPase FlaH